MDAFTKFVITQKPHVLVIPGDLTFNGARLSHEDMVVLLSRVTLAGIPVLVIPGNHDVNCNQAASFEGNGYTLVESVDAGEFARMYGACGYDGSLCPQTIARDEASLSYVWEYAPALRFLLVDVNAVESLGTVPEQTLAWIERQLQDASRAQARVIAFSHQSMLQQTFIDYGYKINNASELLSLYKQYGVLANFCGHLHLQHYMIDEDGFLDVATSALSVSPCQYAYVRLYANSSPGLLGQDEKTGTSELTVQTDLNKGLRGPLVLTYETQPFDEGVSAWAAEEGYTNPDLLDFATYARDFFRGNKRDDAVVWLESQGYANAAELVDFSAQVNYHYFTGTLNQMERRPDLVEQWADIDALTGYYMRYIFDMTPVRDENEIALSCASLV